MCKSWKQDSCCLIAQKGFWTMESQKKNNADFSTELPENEGISMYWSLLCHGPKKNETPSNMENCSINDGKIRKPPFQSSCELVSTIQKQRHAILRSCFHKSFPMNSCHLQPPVYSNIDTQGTKHYCRTWIVFFSTTMCISMTPQDKFGNFSGPEKAPTS